MKLFKVVRRGPDGRSFSICSYGIGAVEYKEDYKMNWDKIDNPDKDGCYQKDFGQCCCTCEFHHPDHEHCLTNPPLRRKKEKRLKKSICICNIQKKNGGKLKFVCSPPDFGRAYSDWPEHSVGCEIHTPKEKECLPSRGPKL